MSPTAKQNPGLFQSVRDARRGDTHRGFTKESIGRAITLLAIPMVLEMTMESLFAVVDMFWVAHLGADAVATIGLTEAVLTLLFAVCMGLSVATAATVARRIGESANRRKESRRRGRGRGRGDRSRAGDRLRVRSCGRLVCSRYSSGDGRERVDRPHRRGL